MYIKLRSEFLVSMQREVRRLLQLIDLSLEDSRSFLLFLISPPIIFEFSGSMYDIFYVLGDNSNPCSQFAI